MTSAGGLEPAVSFRPKDSLLSGPAGGVSGAAAIAEELGFSRILTFDMGGTSTDVSRYDHGFSYRFEQTVGDARLLSPSLMIETVAAGGGSICQWENGSLSVGPDSAGADPGPACYGRGGPLTITDVNLLLGRIDPENFGIPLSQDNIAAAEAAALDLQSQAGRSSTDLDSAFLRGLIDIAVEHDEKLVPRLGRMIDTHFYICVFTRRHICKPGHHIAIRTTIDHWMQHNPAILFDRDF